MTTFANRIQFTTATTGTGTITVGTATSGYRTPATAGLASGSVGTWLITDGTAWEVSTGAYTSAGTTVARTLVESSTGSLLNLSGSATVSMIISAQDMRTLQTDDGTASAPTHSFYSAPTTGMYLSSSQLALAVGGNERMTIDSNGQVTMSSAVSFYPILTSLNTTSDANAAVFRGAKSRSGGAVTNNDYLFSITGQGHDGTTYLDAAGMYFVTDGTPATGSVPGEVLFATRPAGGSMTNRFAIGSSGAFRLGAAQDSGIQGDVLTSGGASAEPSWGGAEYTQALNATYTLTSTTASQSLFPAASDTLTLPVGTYEYEVVMYVASMSGTTGNLSFNILGAGTATIASALSQALGVDQTTITTTTNATTSAWTGTTSGASVVTQNTGTALTVFINGIFRVSVAGTIIPSVALVTAAAAVVQVNTHMHARRISTSATYTTFGPWA